MDNTNFISQLADALHVDADRTSRLVDALCDIMAQCAVDNENTAIPGFGTFEAVKTMEYVSVNPSNGSRTLMPPQINVIFKPGSRLKKSIAKL